MRRRTAILMCGAVTVAVAGVVTALADAEAAVSEGIVALEGDDTYRCFRIPSLVKAADGTLLLFAEGRKPDCSDTGTHDVVVTRSTDRGKTWSKRQVVHAGVGATAHNPAPVLDARTGRVVLLSTRQYRTLWVQHSDDNGVTWTAPREITQRVRSSTWTGIVSGPAHGIQLTRGARAGRLVVGAHYTTEDGHVGGALVYSDDGGTTWQLGAADHSADPDLRVQELSIVERPDGSIFALARDERGTNPATVASAVSTDGGLTFSAPFHAGPAETTLAVPTVQASTLELRAVDKGDRYNRVLLAAPNTQGETRENMTVRSTFKGGTEWVDPAGGTVVYSGMSAYTDMTLIDRNTVGLAYERGRTWSHGHIRFTTFTEADLGLPDAASAGKPTTPDVSGNAFSGYVHGGATTVTGRHGNALGLDGTDDHARLPFAEKLAVSAGDFTWTGWFRYGQRTSTQAMLWAYNMGPSYSQIWLRGEPGNGRLRAWVQSGASSLTVDTTTAYNDKAWHHFAFRRNGDTFTLFIDGEAAGSTTVTGIGSPSPKRPFEIHLGERLDGQQRLQGALDDVRLYGRALSQAEITSLYTTNAALTTGLVIRLPLDSIR